MRGHDRTNVFCESAAAGAGAHFDAVVAQSARSEGIAIRSSATGCPNRLRAHGRWIMAGVSRRDFLQQAGGASAALAFMAANGIKLNANPLGLADWQPDVAASRPHRHRQLRGPCGGAQGHEGDRHRDRRAHLAERRVPSPHRRQADPEDLSTTTASSARARTSAASGPICRRSSTGRTTSA